MIEQIVEYIKGKNLNLYDIAVITEKGIEYSYCQPCNACSASYSITKLFIVTQIGVLFDCGQINLSDRITKLLPDWLDFPYDPVWDGVTVHDALTHRMGIDYGIIDIDRDDTGTYPTDNYLRYIFSYPPTEARGQYRKYTDVPHYLLSLVIEKITGKRAQESITEHILNPLRFSATAWTSCPRNHTIGSSGSYMAAKDMVKLAWLYQNNGVYQGTRIISPKWVQLVEEGQFDLYPIADTGFWGKRGLNGQMIMFDRQKKIAFAWHGYEPEGRDDILIHWLEHSEPA